MSIFSLTKIIFCFIVNARLFPRKSVASRVCPPKGTDPRQDYSGLGDLQMNSGLMTIEDLAEYLKVTRRTIYDWVKHNKIPAIKLIGQWRFKKDKIDAWIDNKSLH